MHKRVIGFIVPVSMAMMLTAGNVLASGRAASGSTDGAEESVSAETTAVSETGGSSTQGQMVISEAGTYTLTGNMRGSVFVNPGAGDVTLILDNATIDGAGASAILAGSGASLTIQTAEGSVNTLLGGDADAVISSDIPVQMEGSGQLILVCDEGQEAVHTAMGFFVHEASVIALNADTAGLGKSARGETAVRFTLGIQAGPGESITVTDAAGSRILSFTAESRVSSMTVWDTAVTEDCLVYVDGVLSAEGGEIVSAAEEEPVSAAEEEMVSAAEEEMVSAVGDSGTNTAVSDTAAPLTAVSDTVPRETSDTVSRETSGTVSQRTSENADAPENSRNVPQSLPEQPHGEMPQGTPPQMPGNGALNGQQGMDTGIVSSADSAGEVVRNTAENTAADLEADYENATTIVVTDENSQVKISESGTYVVTGSSEDGNIVVKKGTTGVVLVLHDLDLTSTTGATLSVNKEAEVKIVISGDVILTDAENPEDENSEDAEIADAFDGAAIRVKAESVVCITGDGSLTINGEAKNGIKGGDDSGIVIDGDVFIDITAANDGINTNYDLTILDGDITIDAEDDAIHADHILTIGDEEDGSGPDITVTGSTEGLEATVVNIFGGRIDITSSDDAVNAANKDGVYEGELEYSINMTGGNLKIHAGGDGLDSNGNINLVDGSASIQSASAGGEAGIDYEGELYISDDFEMNNNSGTAGPDGMPGEMNGGMPGGMNSAAPDGISGGIMPGGQNDTGMQPGAGGMQDMNSQSDMNVQPGMNSQQNMDGMQDAGSYQSMDRQQNMGFRPGTGRPQQRDGQF